MKKIIQMFSINDTEKRLRSSIDSANSDKQFKFLNECVKIAVYYQRPDAIYDRVFLNLNEKGYLNALRFFVTTVERFKLNNRVTRLYLITPIHSLEVSADEYKGLKAVFEELPITLNNKF